jgi:23S rRNA pseudouridine1911/1915/1917 synthase
VLVFTRNSKTAARVAEQFEKREVTKIYWALLESTPEPASGTLTDWLQKIPDEARTEIAEPNSPGAKEARLSYRVLSQSDGTRLVEIELLTGRMHQIRAQFASRGCPVVGDDKYGAAPWSTWKPDRHCIGICVVCDGMFGGRAVHQVVFLYRLLC